MSHIARRGALVACVVVATTAATAAERPISAAKIFLRRSASGTEKLTFVSKDPAFLFPTIGGPDDPTPSGSGGIVVELFAPSTPSGVALTAPGGIGDPGWNVRTSLPPRLQFKNAGAPGAISTFRSITLRQTKVLKLAGKETGIAMGAPLGSVGIRITTGSLVNCARFPAETVRRDADATFIARNTLASATADCSAASLAAAPTTTTTTSTMTTLGSTSTTTSTIPVCGDDVVNQPSEECDGTDDFDCLGYSCGPAGYATACQCCVEGTGSNQLPCCDPSAQPVYYPSTVMCVNQDCNGAFGCSVGVCDNGTCCSQAGDYCALFGGGGSSGFVPCCGDLVCNGGSYPAFTCCAPDGHSCTTNGECCGGNCAAGTCAP
jgi:hypothetical protein